MPSIPDQPANLARPDVIVDFHYDEGMLFIALKNIGMRSAYQVTTQFANPLYGLGGSKCISEMQLFRRVEFMPPGKEFVQPVDSVAAWFKYHSPGQVEITIAYRDREGKFFEEHMAHDLSIYRDLGYIRKHNSGG